jgi:hypothetical protein
MTLHTSLQSQMDTQVNDLRDLKARVEALEKKRDAA